jgi:hypothetical protein
MQCPERVQLLTQFDVAARAYTDALTRWQFGTERSDALIPRLMRAELRKDSASAPDCKRRPRR